MHTYIHAYIHTYTYTLTEVHTYLHTYTSSFISQMVTDEVCFNESIRQVLSVERKIEGGCEHLLDKEQTLIRKGYNILSLYHYSHSSYNAYHIVGFLHIYRNDDKGVTVSRKTRKQCSYCFLFSKHFIIAQRIEKKGEEVYRIQKDAGILPLVKCRIRENSQPTDISGTSIFIHPSTIHLSIRLSVLPFTSCSSIHSYPSIHLFIHPPVHSSIYPSICLSSIYS